MRIRTRVRARTCWLLVILLLMTGPGCNVSISFLEDSDNSPPPSAPAHSSQPEAQNGNELTQAQHVSQTGLPPGATVPPPVLSDGSKGCTNCGNGGVGPGGNVINRLPTEKDKVIHPPYRVAPPDILFIQSIRMVPKPPYRLQPLDTLVIQAAPTFPNQPIAGRYRISPEGYVSLGFSYGSVRVVGMTIGQAQKAIQEFLGKQVEGLQASVALADFQGVQQVQGEHLVRPDGTISLGSYGCVNVTGLSLAQAKFAIERHLSQFLQDPEVVVDVFAYNSKVFYVIADGAGFGQQVYKFPITGNETVLDAIEQIRGLPSVASQNKIWVARPGPAGQKCLQVLPVDWKAITRGGATETNYQLFPGDRVFIGSDPFLAVDGTLAKILAPIERVLGITLLGVTTVRSFSNNQGGNVGFVAGF